jgi:hypothetical protein
MKSQLIAIVAAVLVVGCGPSVDIHEAAKSGNIKAVKQHLAAGADVDAKGGWLGGTPLHYAVGKGHKEIVELLISAGADVNAKGDNGSTPLHFATTKEIAELLIANGADVNAKDNFGFTPLDRAEKVEFWHLEAPREGDGRVYLPGDLNAAKEETAILIREHGGITYREDVEYKFNSLKEQLSRLKHLIIRDDAGVDPDKLSIEKCAYPLF